MIIVVLLFFQSLCLYLQKIVLKVHDKWLNPAHARLLIDTEQQRLRLFKLKPRHPVAGCTFCANSRRGYCRHHTYKAPTLRHLKYRFLAKGSGATGGGVDGREQQVRGGESVEGGPVASYRASKYGQNPAKLCACLSCTKSKDAPVTSRKRTSWGRPSCYSDRMVSGEDRDLGIVSTTRRGRRYE